MTSSVKAFLTNEWINCEDPTSISIERIGGDLFGVRAIFPSGLSELWWTGEEHEMARYQADEFSLGLGLGAPVIDRVPA